MFWRFALRDVVLLAICLLLWQLNMSELAAGHIVIAGLIATVTVIATVLTSYEFHEWGHLSGAIATGAVVHAPKPLIHQFLFHFDGQQNNRHQFVGMSIGGLLASVLVLLALLWILPLSTWSAKIALGIIVLGIIVTFLREVPEAWRVHRGIAVPTGPVYEPF
jgi:hypothetical protein